MYSEWTESKGVYMSLEEFYIHIVKQIEKKVKIKNIMCWTGDIPFIEHAPMEFSDKDYFDYAIFLERKYTKDYSSRKITRYTWLKHTMAVMIMLQSYIESEN